jgi:hypothetical protein
MFVALGAASSYEPIDRSGQLPRLTLTEANRQLATLRSIGRLERMRAFRRHVHAHLAPPRQERAHGPEQH